MPFGVGWQRGGFAGMRPGRAPPALSRLPQGGPAPLQPGHCACAVRTAGWGEGAGQGVHGFHTPSCNQHCWEREPGVLTRQASGVGQSYPRPPPARSRGSCRDRMLTFASPCVCWLPRPHGHEEPGELLLHERGPAGAVQLVGVMPLGVGPRRSSRSPQAGLRVRPTEAPSLVMQPDA